jgi:uncharacterized protein
MFAYFSSPTSIKNMRILYIHGLDSRPNPERISSLESNGHQVYALHLDYRLERNAYARLRQLSRDKRVEFLVGSSLGGLMAFWLGEELGLPCLLYNPAVYYGRDQANIVVQQQLGCPARWVVIGDEDDVVDPEISWQYFQDISPQVNFQRVIRYQGLGHQIDPSTFRETQRWAGL